MLLYRRIRYGYEFRRIPLTQGKYAIVDPDDYERLTTSKWHAKRSGYSFYACRSDRALMHNMVIHVPDCLYADHINHNGLDNRKANLRAVTATENNWNSRKRKAPSTSVYKGIHWQAERKCWRVRISINGKQIHLGCFKDEIAAAKAYDTAAKKLRGRFAVLNFKGK